MVFLFHPLSFQHMTQPRRRISLSRALLVSIIPLLVLVCTVVSLVSKHAQLGTIAVTVASVVTFLLTALMVYGLLRKSRTSLQQSTYHGAHRDVDAVSKISLSPESFWGINSVKSPTDTCPICLVYTGLESGLDCGISKCCQKQIHKECAEGYFISINEVKCPLCRAQFE